jgi:hypothetical protein
MNSLKAFEPFGFYQNLFNEKCNKNQYKNKSNLVIKDLIIFVMESAHQGHFKSSKICFKHQVNLTSFDIDEILMKAFK